MAIRRFVASVVLAVFAAISIAPAAMATECAPGQHGNKKPGYKPASCRK